MVEPMILTIIITNVVLVLSNLIGWMRKIKKSSCCGGSLEMQSDNSEESDDKKKSKKRSK